MQRFTAEDLKQIMIVCAGLEDSVELDGTFLDAPYPELGCDSLAVLEIQSRIQQAFGVPLGDDALEHMPTPGRTVTYVNELLRVGA